MKTNYGTDQLISWGGGGGGSERMPSEQFFCCYNRSAIFFLCMCLANIYVIVVFFRKGREGGSNWV